MPSHEVLYEELCEARTRGTGNRSKPLTDLRGLLAVARQLSSAEADDAKIEDILMQAIDRLGGMSSVAVASLLGLTEDSRGHTVEKRRELAAKAFDHIAPQSFRAHKERQLLMAVATHLNVMAHETPGQANSTSHDVPAGHNSPFESDTTTPASHKELVFTDQSFTPVSRRAETVREVASYRFTPEAGGWQLKIDLRVLSDPDHRRRGIYGVYRRTRQVPLELMIVGTVILGLAGAAVFIAGIWSLIRLLVG